MKVFYNQDFRRNLFLRESNSYWKIIFFSLMTNISYGQKEKPWEQREESNSTKIPFVFTHITRNSNMFKSAKQYFPILQQSIQPNEELYSRRQPPNLKNILTKDIITGRTYKIFANTSGRTDNYLINCKCCQKQ